MRLLICLPLLLAVLVSCTIRPAATKLETEPVHAVLTVTSVTDETVDLYCKETGILKRFHFTYARTNDFVSDQQRDRFSKLASFESREFQMLVLYCQNGAILDSKGLPLPKHLKIEKTEIISGDEAKDLQSGGSWFPDSNVDYYCADCLNLKSGTNEVDFVTVPDGHLHSWVPLTADTWSTWYGLIDKKLGISELFSDSSSE